jgi:ABC-type transport system involved in cytochrome c biogenesis permease subunit
MQSLLFWTAVTAYAVATALAIAGFSFSRERWLAWGRRVGLAALVPHAGALALRWAEVGHGPYNTRYEVLSAQAFLLVGASGMAALASRHLRPLAALVMPVAFLLMGFGVSSFDTRREVPIIFKSWWLILHIGFAKLFGATVALAALCAIAWLWKRRRPGSLPQLPDLPRLDLYAHQFLLAAFLFLGVMIAAGALWANQSWGRYWGWDPIETTSLATWVAYGVILHFRVLHRWEGARMAWLTLVALALAIVTLYVVAVMVPTIHNSYMVGP